jgi:hypothetical protein
LTSLPNRDVDHPVEFTLSEYSDALASIVDETEESWLFKVLDQSSPSSLNRLLPIVEWMEDHRMLEHRPTDRKELLLKLQKRAAKMAPYSSAEQVTQLLDKIKNRHERRIGAAVRSGDLNNNLQAIVDSFFIINKLAIWTVARGLQNVEYLRVVRTNLETVFVGENPLLGKGLSSGEDDDGAVLRFLARTSMAAHVLVLAYITDYLQELTPQFRHVFGKRNYVKEVFDDTFAQTISLLMEKLPSAGVVGELSTVSEEYREVIPGVDFDARNILKSVNLLIMNANSTAHPARPYPLLPVPSE